MKWNWDALKGRMRKALASRVGEGLDPNLLKEMLRGIMTTCPDEIGCDECFKLVDRFIDLLLDGKNAAAAMPLVQDHLHRCGDCRQEYEALLAALPAVS